jgi:ABC-type glycerol-3-phosphate transport system substrate-binding protein
VPSEETLDTPAMAEAMQWLLDLDGVRGAMPSLLEVTGGSQHFVAELVEDGRAAMWDGWPSFSAMRIYQAAYDDLGVVPFPEGTAVADWMGGAPYLMSAGTTHPDEVWRWLRFLTYQPGDVQAVEPPVRRSVAAASGYWAELDPDLSAAVRYVAERPKVALPLGMLSAISNALTGALTEGGDVNAALTRAQVDLSRAFGASVSQTPPPPVPTPVPTAETGVTIEFAATDYLQLEQGYDRLAAEFHTLHPEIMVEPKSPYYGTGRQTVTLEWLASQGDCFAYFYPMVDKAELAVMRLDPLLEADPVFPADDIYPHLLERFYQEGNLWALPRDVSPRVMYYNKALFDRAGLPYPALDWTLDDFAEAATRLTEGEGEEKRYGYSSSGPGFLTSDPLFFLMQRGILPVESSADVPLDAPEIIEAIRWYMGLWQAGVMPKYEVSGPGEGDTEMWNRNQVLWESLIREGRVAMWSTQWGGYESYSRIWANLDVGIASMPQGPGRVVDMMSSAYYISTGTAHPEACWQWLTFLSGEAGIAVGAPVRRSVLNSVEYRQHVDAEAADVYLATLEGSEHVIDSNSIYWNTYEGRLVQAVILALQGEDVEQALRQVQDQREE